MSTPTSGVVPSSIVEIVGPDDPDLVPAAEAALRAAEFAAREHRLSGEIVIAFVSDEEIARLNWTHRQIASPTDVLTFSSPLGGGDIAIATGYLRRQATRRRVAPEDEAAILALHGVLHLAGYDDIEDTDRATMQRETKRLTDFLGVPCEDEWTSLPERSPSEISA